MPEAPPRKGPSTVDLALLFVCVSWAVTHSFVRVLFSVMTPFAMTALRFILMMALGLGILVVRRARFDRSDWPRILLVAMLSHGVYQFAYTLSILHGGAYVAGVVLSTVPVFTVLYALMSRTESASTGLVVGIVLAALCTAGFALFSDTPHSTTMEGALLALLASLLFASYGIVVKPLVAKYSVWNLISMQAVLGGIPLVIAGLPELSRQDWSKMDSEKWMALMFIAFIPAFVSYAAWNWGIRQVGAARTSAYALLVPVLASLVSLIWLHEPWTMGSLVCAFGLLVSLVVTRAYA